MEAVEEGAGRVIQAAAGYSRLQYDQIGDTAEIEEEVDAVLGGA
jgi:hypothetical protein